MRDLAALWVASTLLGVINRTTERLRAGRLTEPSRAPGHPPPSISPSRGRPIAHGGFDVLTRILAWIRLSGRARKHRRLHLLELPRAFAPLLRHPRRCYP